MEDFSKLTRNECVDRLNCRRWDVRQELRAVRNVATPDEKTSHLAWALDNAEEAIALRARLTRLDVEERDAIKKKIDVLKAGAKR